MALPTRHREALADAADEPLTLTKHHSGCLYLFPAPTWATLRDKVIALPMAAEDWKRVFLGGAVDVVPDGTARILIPPELRAYAGLAKDVMLVGMGGHFEVWDASRFAAKEAATLKQELPEELKQFSF